MTTPPTPADWYPDPENPGGLRYWDGSIWTEHRAPAPAQAPAQDPVQAPAPSEQPSGPADQFQSSEQATSIVKLPGEPGAGGSGAHSAPEGTPSYEAPEGVNETGAHAAPTYEAPSYGAPTYEASSYEAPSYEAPSSEAPSFEASSYGAQQPFGAPPPTRPFEAQGGPEASQYGTPPYGTPPYGPPPGGPGGPSDPSSGGGSSKKVLIGLLAGAAALVLVVALALVYVFVIRDDGTSNTASQSSSSTSKSKSSSSASSESESSASSGSSGTETTGAEPPLGGPEGSDGDFVFQIVDVEPRPTVTSTFSDQVEATANGMYAVVHLLVGNTGTEPVTFLATFQRLVASGQTLAPDDIATAYAGGTFTEIPPGSKVETVVVFDVPDGAEPESFELHGSPIGPGVVLPFPS